MSRPPKPSIWTRIAALEGKRQTRADLLQTLRPEQVAGTMAIAVFGQKNNPAALAYVLDISIDDAKRSLATQDKLIAMSGRRRKHVSDEEAVVERLTDSLSQYPEIVAQAEEYATETRQ